MSKRNINSFGFGVLWDIYGWLTRIRNFFYDRGWFKTVWLDAAVISVGNMTTGGTGKTPMVIFLSELIREIGLQPGVILRGYGNDEVILLQRELPGVPVIANPDRISAGKRAIAESARILIADDAFQHRRLGRDLNICLVDALAGFCEHKMLPAGHLREPLDGISRADIVVLTRCDQVEPERIETIKSQIREFDCDIPILVSEHRVRRDYEFIYGKKVFAFAAIGQPESFFETVRKVGGIVVGTKVFRDHHHFSEQDLKEICQEADTVGAEFVLCTSKDIVKIDRPATQNIFEINVGIYMNENDRKILKQKVAQACLLESSGFPLSRE